MGVLRALKAMRDLFDGSDPLELSVVPLSEGAGWLRSYALQEAPALIRGIEQVVAQAPWQKMKTPGGQPMSVQTSSCGVRGWVSGPDGYGYSLHIPRTGRAWPAMPGDLLAFAQGAAAHMGYENFEPDACLINRYGPGAQMGLHQDRDERDLKAPIVSVSLGLPAVFLWGGLSRADKTHRVPLAHGDVVVWGGASRLRFHGVMPVLDGHHPLTGRVRLNLTFRQTGLG